MWGAQLTGARVAILVGVVLAACVASSLATWQLMAVPKIEAAELRGEKHLSELRADYETKRANAERRARADLQAEIDKAEEADRAYQQRLEDIQREADARPPRTITVRVPVPAACPGSGADRRAAGGPGIPEAPSADAGGVGPDAGGSTVTLDVSGFDLIVDRAKQVSAQLDELLGVCDG
mgnify:CR=1 FL=1|jgi:hypothetical protein